MLQPTYKPYHLLDINGYHVAIPKPVGSYIHDTDVYLLYTNDKRVLITQPPGTQYKYLPSDFGADSYIVKSRIDGNEKHINDYISVNNKKTERRKLQ